MRLPSLPFLLLLAWPACCGAYLIRDVQLADGSGAALVHGAVRVEGATIVAVGGLDVLPGEEIIEGRGLVLAPGFIDTHSHHDNAMLERPAMEEVVSQGITTVVLGQDGDSALPLASLWQKLRARPVATNVASYSGHNTLRASVMGSDFRRRATAAEIARMRALLDADMRAGALGLATGLEYDPGIYSSPDEVLTLARAAHGHGGRYISHIRSEDRRFEDAITELLEIGRATGMPVQISHFKLAMVSLWGRAPEFLARLDAARAEGIDVTVDIYPYEHWQSDMTVLFPGRDFNDYAEARLALSEITTPEHLYFAEYEPDPGVVGKSLAEVAAARGAEPARLYLDMTREAVAAGAGTGIIARGMQNQDIREIIRWPHANICSDGGMNDRHPRGTGAFTRVLRMAREEQLLSLPDAVRRMSGLAADHMGFTGRGYLRPGAAADLVLFDPETVADRSTFDEPAMLSGGIEGVWVNGVRVWDNGQATGALPGRMLLRGAGSP